jgi:hypothetical protein
MSPPAIINDSHRFDHRPSRHGTCVLDRMSRGNAAELLRETEALMRSELRTIAEANAVGQIVVEEYYGGIAEFHAGTGGGSLRELSDAVGGRLSSATLWRAASIYVLGRCAPELLSAKNLRLSHLYAVLDLPREHQLDLLRRAEQERWTSERLKQESPRFPTRVRSGVRSTQLAALCSALSRLADLPLPARSKVSAEAVSTLLILVDTAQDRLDTIRSWISSVPMDE